MTPDSWRTLLLDHVLLSHAFDAAGLDKLAANSHALAARLHWEGCLGQEITDVVKATIAGQAALLVQGLDGYLFDDLATVLVYPGGFLATSDEDEETEMRLGEAMEGGPVVLSWWHARWAGRRLSHENVVIHEFAHKLAELGDPDLGMPPFGRPADAKQWKKVMNAARRKLEQDDLDGVETLLDPYGAESLAEFFAVASETFFLRPQDLRKEMPAVYNLLSACYRQDTAMRALPERMEVDGDVAEVEYATHAAAECTAAIRLRPDYVEAYAQRAGWREELGDLDGAIADWAEVARRGDGPDERADAMYAQADILEKMGRDAEATRLEAEADRLLD